VRRREDGESVVLLPKSIDNSQVVREVDPRSRRDLVLLLATMAALVAGLVLYAWPHFEIRQTGLLADEMKRERERLVEESRKLRLEKAALENLRRVERIAARELGLAAPEPEQVVVVERAPATSSGPRLASDKPAVPAGGRGSAPDRARN
jgi:cell division protein FtsL